MPIRKCDGLHNELLRDSYGLFINFLCLVMLSEPTLPEKDRRGALRPIDEQVVSTSRLAIERPVQPSDWTETGIPQRPRRFGLGDRTVDLERHLITIGDFQVHLTQIECRLLDRMWAKRNRTIPSESLVDVLWVRMPGVVRTRFGLWSKMSVVNSSPILATRATLSSTAESATG